MKSLYNTIMISMC